ncbi:MAG: metal-dependent hydrolase [Candidatus Parvarchaeota archaeon]|nr:metal-dependent hydrolase [Candidatus Parvarchaeota archaeon]MCW1294533.1 metal-dependent hydrolase [Candidatus Parvarchaeum tengchongense]MCW1295807.1 metal-dependent hydrolase [Candidatus Parvarchaeum tengchongense]MCW1299012.1 metal-dependent hydrolase [Candidatus Parvarchaeum tengchongense]MCW1312789.1 metal-dependent hydrolase [Candidatus Parvarchaeum tengchongense]
MVSVKWLGHAAWIINFKDTTVIIDPFLTNNPKAAMKAQDVKVDMVFVTHNHFDHLGDAFDIAKRNNAKLVGKFELSLDAQKAGISEANAIGMNIGSMTKLGSLEIAMVPAIHSGNEGGFIIRGDGKTIYHAGDTALFSDMQLIKKLYKPDVAMLPIGGFFTMGPKEAAIAAKYIGAKIVFPMHYNTFPPIVQDANKFAKMVKGSKVVVLEPGQETAI